MGSRFFRCLRLLVKDSEVLVFAGVATLAAAAPVGLLVKAVYDDPGIMSRPLSPRLDALLATPFVPVLLAILAFLPCILIGSLMNAAIVGCLAKRLEGGEPTLRDGLRAIGANLGSILEIVLLTFGGAAVLGFLASLIPGKDGDSDGFHWEARAAVGAASQTMFAASALLLCIMIVESCGFREAWRRAKALKSEFAEILAYSVSADWLVMIPSMIWFFGFLAATFNDRTVDLPIRAFVSLMIGPPIVLFFATAIALAILNLAFICAVYLAAARADAPSRAAIAEYFPEVLAAPAKA